MPWAFTAIEPPTVKISVDCIAITANRGWRKLWMSCQVAPLCTVKVRVCASSDIRFSRVMSRTIASGANACPPHAVPDARDRHLQAVVTGEGEGGPDVVDLAHRHDAVDGRPAEAARVVDRAAPLHPDE